MKTWRKCGTQIKPASRGVVILISMYDKNHPAPDSAQLTGSFSTTDEDLALETDRKPAEVVAVGVKGSVLQRHVVYHQVGTISNIKKYVADSQPEKNRWHGGMHLFHLQLQLWSSCFTCVHRVLEQKKGCLLTILIIPIQPESVDLNLQISKDNSTTQNLGFQTSRAGINDQWLVKQKLHEETLRLGSPEIMVA